jgi:hypothetical protein
VAGFSAPIRAAAPALLPPENPEPETDVVESKGVVPLLLPCDTTPPVTPGGRPLVGLAAAKSQRIGFSAADVTPSAAAWLVTAPTAFAMTTS